MLIIIDNAAARGLSDFAEIWHDGILWVSNDMARRQAASTSNPSLLLGETGCILFI